MNKLDKDYQNLVLDVLNNGVEKGDRTGTGTISVFGRSIRHNMDDGFPLLTTKKLNFKNIWTELVWFIAGDTNLGYLVDNDNFIWVGDAFKRYNNWLDNCSPGALMPEALSRLEFIERIKNDDDFRRQWGDLGPIYGKQWRNFDGVDQLYGIIEQLRENPDSRRMMVNAWNVGELDSMVLPPCHYGFQVYTEVMSKEERWKRAQRGFDGILTEEFLEEINFPTRKISLKWDQRSVDTGLGLPYNIASYGLLLLMLAQEVRMIPSELVGFFGDTHIYKNHVEGLREQVNRTPFKLPTVKIQDGMFSNFPGDFDLYNYESHPAIKLELSN